MNAVPTSIYGKVLEMHVSDNVCSLIVEKDDESAMWYSFEESEADMARIIDSKLSDGENYSFVPDIVESEFPIDVSGGWTVRTENRELSYMTNSVQDAYTVLLKDDDGGSMWHMSQTDCNLKAVDGLEINDVAYESNGNRAYILFAGDEHLYAYDNIQSQADSRGRVFVAKENATLKLDTMHTSYISDIGRKWRYVYLDYDESGNWTIRLYGSDENGSPVDVETMYQNPGNGTNDFKQSNTIAFGDSLLTGSLLKFQKISMNKDMFDLVDVSEVDGCHYGLFRDESISALEKHSGRTTYTVFKVVSDGDVVQRLPYTVLLPKLHRTSDNLYSLYVLMQTDDG